MNRDELRSMLVLHEGLRLRPYKCTAGKVTIGVGRNLDDKGITQAEAFELLEHDIDDVERDLDSVWPWWRQMTDARQQVLADMCFNLGIGRLKGFVRTLDYMKKGDYKAAADGMLDSLWARQVGNRAQRLAKMMREG
jgi:lysozyme